MTRNFVSNYNKVREFHEATGLALDVWPPTDELINLRTDLIREEVEEIIQEVEIDMEEATFISELGWDIEKIDKKKLAKEIADLLYVAYGMAATFGIPIDDVFAEVHRSNMSKLGDDGKPVRREDGKVLKGPNYTPPDLEKITW